MTDVVQDCECCGEDCDSDGVCPIGCQRCAYCDCVVPDLGVPDAQQDRLWTRLSEDHDERCEWISTRAHRSYRRTLGMCPSCGDVKLSKHEIANHYQCPNCTSRDEGTGY